MDGNNKKPMGAGEGGKNSRSVHQVSATVVGVSGGVPRCPLAYAGATYGNATTSGADGECDEGTENYPVGVTVAGADPVVPEDAPGRFQRAVSMPAKRIQTADPSNGTS